jgi:hypothetical protein
MLEKSEERPFGDCVDVQVTREKSAESRDVRKMIWETLICGD